MTTGTHPFPSTTDSQYLLRHADDEPPPPSNLRAMPDALEQVVLRCLAKQPAGRFPTATAVAEALRAIDLEVQAPASAPRKSGKAGWIAAAVLVLGGGAAAAAVLVPRYLQESASTASAARPAPTTPNAPAPDPVAAQGSATPPAPPDNAQIEPTSVTIEFVSTPPGASVTRAGETVPLGTTPFSASLARSDRSGQVRFERPGHEAIDVEVPLIESQTIEVAMTRVNAVVSKQPAKAAVRKKPGGDGGKPTQVQREGVMDPFAN